MTPFLRAFRTALLFACLVALPANGAAQSAVVKRNVHLRAGPATSFATAGVLLPGTELVLVAPAARSGFLNVRTASGRIGWVWSRNIRVLEGGTTLAAGAIYRGCGPEGNAQHEHRRALNVLKNRYTAPLPADVDSTVTLARLLDLGTDEQRWSTERAAAISGYVIVVKAGGVETVNCGETDQLYRDTHIEIVPSPADTLKRRRMIVEVTPRWRALMAERGLDWTTRGLRQQLRGRCARFTGWLFWDAEHDDEAENTRPGRVENWRATAWELHPVTGIELEPCPAPQ